MSRPWNMGELMAGAYSASVQAGLERAAEDPRNPGFASDMAYPHKEWISRNGDQIMADARAAGGMALGRSDALPLDIQAIAEKHGLGQ
ncbi:MAG TPA: hypothetical protein VD735_07400 [Candidatus Saccharimonadales bacterium]|nr:hypothetical protein [Candidatus Saccharimonadales bacterium]